MSLSRFSFLTKQFQRNFVKNIQNNVWNHDNYENNHRVKHLLDSLAGSQEYECQKDILNRFVNHIENDPVERIKANKEGAVKILLAVQEKCKEYSDVVQNSKLGLALLGYPGNLPTDGIRILSLDGGGIRGIVMMELLKRLEEMTNKRIFELFDFVCGTSNGAIIICGLAADKNLTLTQSVNLYKNIAYRIFHMPTTMDVLTSTSRLLTSQAYYDTSLWEKLLKQHMGYTRMIDTAKFPHCTKFCCVSTTIDEKAIDAYVFRNYVFPYNVQSVYIGNHTACLWEVVRASSAAPAYFGDFKLNGQLHQDGGILFNNPAIVAVHEAKLLWPNQKIQCLVSFGTGRAPNKQRTDGQKLYNSEMLKEVEELEVSSWRTKLKKILEAATDTEQTHYILSDLMSPGSYFRFNPYLTSMVKMVETSPEKIAQLEKDALMYFRRNEDKFEQVAELLTQPKTYTQVAKDYLTEKFAM